MNHPHNAAHLRSGWIITVDPGTNHPAVAIFDRSALTHASRVKIPTVALRALEEGERVRQIVNLIVMHVHAQRPDTASYPHTLAVVHEWPQAYRAGKSKNSASQLFPLAAIGAGVAIALNVEAISPLPSEWIGQVPKCEDGDPWISPRGKLIHSRLTVVERATVVPSHDSLDAAGLGLWALGRLGRNYPGTI